MIRTNGWLTVLLSAASEEHFDKESAVQAEPTEVFIWVHGKPSLPFTHALRAALKVMALDQGDCFDNELIKRQALVIKLIFSSTSIIKDLK